MTPTIKTARYGWRPDKPDHRDHLFVLTMGATPALVDHTSEMPGVYDQGQLGSCTANAIAGALQFDRRKQKLADYVPSRLMIYYEERKIEGTISEDAGAEIRDGMKAMATTGACDEKLWPYNIAKFTQKAPASAYKAALADQAIEYARVTQSQSQIEAVLAGGFPISFGFTVYESFESDKVAKTGIVPMPKKSEQVLGGHAVLLVGYDRSAKQFIVRNSWGAAWGKSGYFRMPYAYVLDGNLADDFWVIRSVG